MTIGSTQIVIIGGVIGAFVVSTIAQNLVEKNALSLDRDLRERIWKREAQTFSWWRLLESAGIAAMIAGMAKMIGFIHSSVDWGIPTMAIGFTIVCLATSLRTWLSNKAYSIEAPGTPASRSAFSAAIWVTITELSLGCAVCWFIFSHIPAGSKTSATTTPAVTVTGVAPSPATPSESRDALWVDEGEALRLLKGKDAAYLKALATRKDIRAREENGKTEYRRDDISAMKLAGLPSMEELTASLEQTKNEPPPVVEKPKEEPKKGPTEKVQE